MKVTLFFEAIGILKKYGGDSIPKKKGDPESRVRLSTTGVSETDAKRLLEIGFKQDDGLWYCDT